MSNYMMRYRGKYRLRTIIDMRTNDFLRDSSGNIDDDADVYIECKNGVQIYAYGKDGHREMQLAIYSPSRLRGRNIKKQLNQNKISYDHYDETDAEAMMTFSANDIDKVAEIIGAKTSGKNISPFSPKNLPKTKVDIPYDKMAEYKEITTRVGTSSMSVIRFINLAFLDEILAKKLREPGKRKPYDYKSEQKKLGLARDVKGYIYTKGMFDEYLSYMSDKIDEYLKTKGKE